MFVSSTWQNIYCQTIILSNNDAFEQIFFMYLWIKLNARRTFEKVFNEHFDFWLPFCWICRIRIRCLSYDLKICFHWSMVYKGWGKKTIIRKGVEMLTIYFMKKGKCVVWDYTKSASQKVCWHYYPLIEIEMIFLLLLWNCKNCKK